jgi:hypothetical protein
MYSFGPVGSPSLLLEDTQTHKTTLANTNSLMMCWHYWRALLARYKGYAPTQKGTGAVRARRDQQSLSYPLRLPDKMQADALRLLDVSREVINLTVAALWDQLDAFAIRTDRYAYKQVEELLAAPVWHGHRQSVAL